MMAGTFARSVLRVAVAQMCQNVGWHAVQGTPLELLVDILHRYLEEVGKTTHRYSEQFGRTEPNLDDLGLAFKDIGIPLGELEEFVNNVEPVPFVHDVPKFPVDRPNNLQFPKPESREVQNRPEWIHKHMPLMNPEAEEEDDMASPIAIADDLNHKELGLINGSENSLLADGSRKRPLDIEALMQTPKRARLYSEDEGRPMREVTSVFMTAAGVISPVREGRLPEAKTPSKLVEEPPASSPETPSPVCQEVKKEPKKDGKKEVKKDVKKEDKKAKEKKDKNKDLKKKSGKKDKEKKENRENKKRDKNKDKGKVVKANKGDKARKDPGALASDVGKVGLAAKIADIKAKVKTITKSPKQKQNKLKPFFLKPKHKAEKTGEYAKFLKVKSKKKALKPISTSRILFSSKSLKAPKSRKPTTRLKVSKSDKNRMPDQVTTLVIKAPTKEKNPEVIFPDPESLQAKASSPMKPEPLHHFSGEDSPERLVIDDNPETIKRQEKESRLAAVNDSINAAIQRGLEETEKQMQESSKSYHETIEGVIRQGMVESHVKLEPRDVYDFTDDEMSPPATPAAAPPRTPEVASPPKKKPKKEGPESGKKVKDKIKEKIKQKSKDSKSKSKSPSSSCAKQLLALKTEPVDERDEAPKTPESHNSAGAEQESPVSFQTPFPRLPGLNHFPHPYFSQISQVPPALLPYPPPTIPPLPPQFQSHTPPNMPMPPMGFYVRNPKPESGSHKGSLSPVSHVQPFTPLNACVDLFDEPSSKGKQDKGEDGEKVKSKDHKREKKEKKEKESEKESEKEKLKTKKKKEKLKEKERKKPSEPEKSRQKGKDKVPKSREKAKDKEKNKTEKKEKKKKEDKIKEEKDVTGSPSNSSGIPKITFKLGNTSATEGPKIVIKPVLPRDGIQSSSSSPTKESTPPPVSSAKSHPKPQSKVNPVPPAPKASASTSSAPARTVITETVGTIIDEQGNKIWICPACTRPDDGSAMIGCDDCDDWYHWVCVGIVVPPKEEESWYCGRCIGKKKQTLQKKKKKKHRKDKVQS